MDAQSSYFKIKLTPLEEVFKPEVREEISEKVYAHVRKGKPPEEILNHSSFTLEFYSKLVQELSLGKIIDDLIDNIYSELEIKTNKEEFKDFLWKCISNAVYYHDLGKFNIRYQKERLGNQHNFKHLKDFGDSKHSKYSASFLSWILLKDLEKSHSWERGEWDTLYKLFYVGLVIISIVDRHHTSLKNLDKLEEEIASTGKGLQKEFFPDVEWSPQDFLNGFKQQIKRRELQIFEDTNLFYLYKLAYSLLIDSDYYATLCYEEGLKREDIELKYIDDKTKKEIIDEFYTNKEYNKNLKNEKYVKSLRDSDPSKIKDLNELRTKILIEASDSIRRYLDDKIDRVFFLNVPTGGGKTNISMKLLIDILEHPNSRRIKRAYYVFPYVNIIEQNRDSIAETLTGKTDQDIVSTTYYCNEWDFSLEKKEELKYYVNQQFLNGPVNIISSVNFFNTFIKNRKRINYKTANLANSIIILDEIQTLPNHMWEYFSKTIWDIAEKYNMYFIIMSATLPDLSKFLKEKEARSLIDDPKKYHQHPLFKRNKIILDRKEKMNPKEDYGYFVDKIQKERDRSSEKNLKILCVVNTVKNSRLLFDKLVDELPDFEVLLLNSTIIPPRRREIVKKFNKDTKKLEKGIVLISTQSVEAGMDIDCHFGFREISPADSIEQVAGRINREGKKSKNQSKVFLFDMGTSERVYSEDARIEIQKNLGLDKIKNIVNCRHFDKFYDRVIKYLKDREAEYNNMLFELLKPTRDLRFEDLGKQDYIKDNSITLFFPLELKLGSDGYDLKGIDYLKDIGMNVGDKLCGSDVWNVLKEAYDRKLDGKAYLEIRKLQSLLNNFTISVADRSRPFTKKLEKLVKTGKFESAGGIINVGKEFSDKFYEVEKGLNISAVQRESGNMIAENII